MGNDNNEKPSRRQILQGGMALLASSLPGGMNYSYSMVAQGATKRIYIAPDDHTDYLWSADDVTYRQVFQDTIDYYLDLADLTDAAPSDFQSRWNCDGSLWMWEYEKNKPAADFDRLIERIRSGHISVPLNSLVLMLGGTPAEAVIRGMYYPGQIERRYNIRFPLVYSMENQTLPYGLVSLWAGAGGRYSWRGICRCSTKVAASGDRQHDIYWWVGPDGSRILMKWNTMWVNNVHMGGYAEARNPDNIVNYVDTDANFRSRFPYNVIGAFGQGWDDLQTMTDDFVNTAIAESTPSRRVIVSNELDFFRDFEATYGSSLPTVAASFGNEWELDYVSITELAARVKRAVEKLRSAEALATVVSLIDPTFMDGREAARDLAFLNMGLFYEHDWSSRWIISSAQRLAWGRRIVNEIENYVDTLFDDGVNALGGMIINNSANPRFYAFNPLSWVRTDYVDIPYTNPTPVHVIDCETSLEIPSQIIILNGQRYLRILARNVPSVGYKVYEIQPGGGAAFPDAATVTGNIIENNLYRITVEDRGAISSLIDKVRGNREFIRNIGGRVANDMGPSAGTLTVENVGPVSVTLVGAGANPLRHESRITLFAEIDRIDIRDEILENFEAKETWAFGFELTAPDTWHEEVGAVTRARLVPAGGHYSPRQARYEYLTFNHFADMTSGGSIGITLSNADLYFFQLGLSDNSILDTTTPQINALIGGRIDAVDAGVPNQGGDTYFLQRFALRTHDAYNQTRAMKFALEHQNPLVGGIIAPIVPIYPEKNFSLLTINNPNVLLWALKPADDGIANGIVPRVWNVSEGGANFSIKLNGATLSTAQITSHIETPLRPAAVVNGVLNHNVPRNGMASFLMVPGPLVPTAAPAAAPALAIYDPIITKSVFPPFAVPGEAVSWTITVVNTGNLPITNLRLVDNMPPEVEIVSSTSTSGTMNVSGQTITWTQALLNPGESVTLNTQGRVRANAVVPFVIRNRATLTTDEDNTERSAEATLISASLLPVTGE